ncbi:hypothetical protein AOC36_08100 [Erysipelothrix larvae]|uniref:Uncharacterized protein n=1 Tax=Erysipelothrix larvae TaxID=1514105 RepID=A0A0X8H0X2_9FIRM|nr:BglG family transcription antiterminator [Erysipelothrix larvae]AMC93949.1 hypothetical protein AOC36_08100 [Erysipelothrix larvae]
MNRRQKQILSILTASKDWVRGVELSKRLDVTDRTIRSDIEKINSELGNVVESNTRKGYRLSQTSDLGNVLVEQKNQIPQTPEERTFYIIKKLLFLNRPIRIFDLQEELFVSDYTIETDLKRIRKLIKPYKGIRLVRTHNNIFFESNEYTKRKLYRDLINSEIHGNFMNLNKIASQHDKFNLISVTKLLQEVMESYDYQMRDSTLPLIVLHIGIMTERMILGHNLPPDLSKLERVDTQSEEYKIAVEFLERLSKILPIRYNDWEIYEVVALLLGYKNPTNTVSHVQIKGEIYSVTQCIQDIITYLDIHFDIDLKNDDDFKSGIHLHLQSLFYRIENGIEIQNTYLQEVKMSYPMIFEMAIHVARLISDYFGIVISEAETGFIAIHLGTAYERNIASSKYRAMLITSSNQAFSKVTKEKLDGRFNDRMDIVSISSYFEIKEIEESNVDILICVTQIEHSLDIPTVKISMFVNTEDEANVFNLLNQLDKRRSKLQFAHCLSGLIEDQFFYTNESWQTPEEVIESMSNNLFTHQSFLESFKESVLEREKYAATSFEIGLATPHPIVFESSTSHISIATLEKPVKWGSYEVHLVILLAISHHDRETLEAFFSWLSNAISNQSKFDKLINSKNRDEFVYWMLEDM